ncbi:unnamed protein product [Penicillium salamii]|uniref:Uncharacterized protein n=1 Tax=Penicillium salamii TaxID=1612424 RepID=A0A9W4NAW7_9EURO|nr:unnamed protein product [Penicillium salamii]
MFNSRQSRTAQGSVTFGSPTLIPPGPPIARCSHMIPRFNNGISAPLSFLGSVDTTGFNLHVHNITESDRIAVTTTEELNIDKQAGMCRAIASERTGYIPDFAIASAKGLNYLTVRPTGYEFDTCWGVKGSGSVDYDITSGHRGQGRYSEVDTFAVDFIAPNLIASGGAGEKVLLTDKRQSDTFTVGIFHSGPISEIKALNDHHLVVSGLNGTATGRSSDNVSAHYPATKNSSLTFNIKKTICLYDLRNRKKVNGQTATCWEKPATFTGSLPKFEVCPDLGLLALVDKERVPRLVSLKDGTPVQSSISQMGDARRVKFDHCNGHLTLLAANQQGEVTEYS